MLIFKRLVYQKGYFYGGSVIIYFFIFVNCSAHCWLKSSPISYQLSLCFAFSRSPVNKSRFILKSFYLKLYIPSILIEMSIPVVQKEHVLRVASSQLNWSSPQTIHWARLKCSSFVKCFTQTVSDWFIYTNLILII